MLNVTDYERYTVVIRFRGWKIYAPEVEDGLEKHPLIARAIVVGVPDRQAGHRVGALLVMKDPESYRPSKQDHWDLSPNLNLSSLQRWLALEQRLSVYKLPTLLRLVRAADTVPTTTSGKVQKPEIVHSFFSNSDLASGQVEFGDFLAKGGRNTLSLLTGRESKMTNSRRFQSSISSS